MIHYKKPSLIRLTDRQDVTLFLIREELKTRRLFNILRKAGFDYCPYQPNLDSLILRSVDLDEGSDEVFERYYEIMERRCRKIKADQDTVTKQAMKAYMELTYAGKELTSMEEQDFHAGPSGALCL